MERKEIDASIEQKIITGMVVSKEFLSPVASTIDIELIKGAHFQRIAKWCVKYFLKYREAPKENIESIYQAWVSRGKASEEEIDAVHDVLEYLSGQYEYNPDLNIPYLVDITASYFDECRMEDLKNVLEYSLDVGDQKDAFEAIAKFTRTPTTMDMGIDPLNEEDAWDVAFGDSQEPLITFGDKPADRFFGNALCRDSLLGILAPEKRGKTWWCLEFCVRGLMQRRRVALFEVGDLSEPQTMRRLGVRFSRRPMFKKDLGVIDIPARIKRRDDEILLKHRKVNINRIANADSSKKAVKKFLRGYGIKPKDTHYKVSTQSNSSVNIADIRSILEQWESNENFIPDIIIIDYPDILAPEPGTSGLATRDQINATWKAMRRLSQDKHCLVIAPTQADAASYNVETLTVSNFSEDKRKIAHVTAMMGLNQTREEKARGLMRLNWLALRESDFESDYCLNVASCLTLGKAFCCSTM